MGNKLYVANLAFHLTETEIKDLFSPYGSVQEVKIILDKMTGKSRGFAFVTMASDGEAERALSEMTGRKVEGRPLAITEARPREERPPGFRPPASGGGSFRPQQGQGGQRPPAAPGRPSGTPNFGQDRAPFSTGGGRSGGENRDRARGGDPRKEKEKPRGPRPIRNYDDDEDF